jgi:hypothetical protein
LVYEEGTWTPVFEGSGGSAGSSATTYNSIQARYIRIGNQVTVNADVSWSNRGSWTGTTKLTGLPYTVKSDTFPAVTLSTLVLINFQGGTTITAYATATRIVFTENVEDQAYTELSYDAFDNTSNRLKLSLTYTI